VANPLPLVAWEDLIWDAGLSMSNENAAKPIGNAQGIAPVPVAESTTTTTTITITSAGTPDYLALINCNAATGTFAGHAITFPGLDLEDQRINACLDLRLLGIGGGPWSLVLNVPSGVVWVGRIVLATAIYPLNIKHGTWKRGRVRPGEIRIPTNAGHIIKHSQALRGKWAEGVVDITEDETLMSNLDLAGRGDYFPCLLIPDENVNEAWWVHQTAPFEKSLVNYDVPEHKLRFEELVMGPVNG
jgi:hypothetical protein